MKMDDIELLKEGFRHIKVSEARDIKLKVDAILENLASGHNGMSVDLKTRNYVNKEIEDYITEKYG